MVTGVTGDLGECVPGHVVQESNRGREHAPIHDQLTEESSVPDRVEKRALVTPMTVQVRNLKKMESVFFMLSAPQLHFFGIKCLNTKISLSISFNT